MLNVRFIKLINVILTGTVTRSMCSRSPAGQHTSLYPCPVSRHGDLCWQDRGHHHHRPVYPSHDLLSTFCISLSLSLSRCWSLTQWSIWRRNFALSTRQSPPPAGEKTRAAAVAAKCRLSHSLTYSSSLFSLSLFCLHNFSNFTIANFLVIFQPFPL